MNKVVVSRRWRGYLIAGWLLLCLGVEAGTSQQTPPSLSTRVISVDLQHADIHDALRLLAAVGEVNIIANHEVQGTITARLQQVPWEQALAVILQMTGLSQERQGNVILVAPGSLLRRAEAERQQARQAALAAEPVITRVIPVHYTDAAALATIIEQWLGRCAMLSVHQHTNTLVLTGTPACLRLLPTSVFSKAGSPP